MIDPVTIGAATLYLGDCREILPALTFDHIIVDPPYSTRTHDGHDTASQDRRDGAEARKLGYEALSDHDARALAKLFHGACPGWVAWLTDSELAGTIRSAFDGLGRTTFAPVPYHHPGRSVRLAGDGPSSWTDWLVVARTKAQNRWGTLTGGYIAGPGWDDKERMGGKPTRLMRQIVSDYSRHGDLVCDPFMGSGTTGVACCIEGRRFVGIEIDEEAFEGACNRIRAAQGFARLLPLSHPSPGLFDEVAA